jgi:hypothetical protein
MKNKIAGLISVLGGIAIEVNVSGKKNKKNIA